MTYDVVLIGGGIAGVTLAWFLQRVGATVLIVQHDRFPCASRIAAGLITPITGKRFALSWRFQEFWQAAEPFYRSCEHSWQTELLHVPRAVRIFQSAEEESRFLLRMSWLSEWEGLSREPIAGLQSPFGYFTMPRGSRLNISRYLEESYKRLNIVEAEFNWHQQARATSTGWVLDLPKVGTITTKDLVLCQGDQARLQGPFQKLPFLSAKGEILRLRIPQLACEKRIIHSGIWLVHDVGEEFLCGSTYEWDQLDSLPTEAGRQKLLEKIDRLLKVPYEIIDHQAGVRPIIDRQRPVIGWHPHFPRLGIFNGLGSKGSLLAPYFAEHFVNRWHQPDTIDPEVNVRRFEL